jgi:hypothetical protein
MPLIQDPARQQAQLVDQCCGLEGLPRSFLSELRRRSSS